MEEPSPPYSTNNHIGDIFLMLWSMVNLPKP